MRILIFCNKLPYPARDGGAVAIYNMIKGYHEAGAEVSVLALNTFKHYFPAESIPAGDVLNHVDLHTVTLNTNVTIPGAIANLINRKAYHASRFQQKPVQVTLAALLNQRTYDVIQVEGVYLSPYLPLMRARSKAAIVLRAHNVENAVWNKVAAQGQNPLKKAYLKLQAERLKQFESLYLPEYDALMPINPADLEAFRGMGFEGPVLALPTGLNLAEYPMQPEKVYTRNVFHLGAMDWLPNQDAVQWLLEAVWPGVKAAMPEAKLELAGRNMPHNPSYGGQEGVSVHGEVPDALEFMQRSGVMVVPLRSGSGMRIKIIEGMALGKAIVTTSLGASGIQLTHGHDALIANDAAAFTNCVLECLQDPAYQAALGARARATAARYYDLKAQARKALDFLQTEIISSRQSNSSGARQNSNLSQKP